MSAPNYSYGVDGSSSIQGSQGNPIPIGSVPSNTYLYYDGTSIIGSQGTQGPQGYQGSTGSQGPQGTQGNQGSQGTQGNQGSQGTQGTSGGAYNFILGSIGTSSTASGVATPVSFSTPAAFPGFNLTSGGGFTNNILTPLVAGWYTVQFTGTPINNATGALTVPSTLVMDCSVNGGSNALQYYWVTAPPGFEQSYITRNFAFQANGTTDYLQIIYSQNFGQTGVDFLGEYIIRQIS